jgi:hypothetical protein
MTKHKWGCTTRNFEECCQWMAVSRYDKRRPSELCGDKYIPVQKPDLCEGPITLLFKFF